MYFNNQFIHVFEFNRELKNKMLHIFQKKKTYCIYKELKLTFSIYISSMMNAAFLFVYFLWIGVFFFFLDLF